MQILSRYELSYMDVLLGEHESVNAPRSYRGRIIK